MTIFYKRYIQKQFCFFLITSFSLFQFSCKKDWLDAKPDKALVVPSTINDYQAILDNNFDGNLFNINQPALCETGSDNYFVSNESWQSFYLAQDRNAYIWAKAFYAGETGYDWNNAYTRILTTNIILDGIDKINHDTSNLKAWNSVKGSAFFLRSFDFFNLAQEFCKTYDVQSSSTDMGIPLKLTANINDKSIRATVKQTYGQIVRDLLSAEQLLPNSQLFPTRPSKAAVDGLLARVYLVMGDYNNAYLFADKALNISNSLLDFNTLDPASDAPFDRFNKEVLFYSVLTLYDSGNCYSPYVNIDSTLFNSYNDSDIRKKIYFSNLSGITTYKGYYQNDYAYFGGVATDELYLIRSECSARLGNTAAAMDDLNTLLKTRWISGSFTPFTASGTDDALTKILAERRKELIFRGLRWSDLRRLNKDTKLATVLTRKLSGTTYTLPPNDVRYVLPIPDDEIRLSGITQNPR